MNVEGQKGFTLLELILALGFISCLMASLVPFLLGLEGYYVNHSAFLAQNLLAGRIGCLQTRMRYERNGRAYFKLLKAGKGYYNFHKGIASNFFYYPEHGLGAFRLEGQQQAAILPSGVVIDNPTYIVSHSYQRAVGKMLEIQPVTGRMIIHGL